MRCPNCQSLVIVVLDTRSTGDGWRRRRQCGACGHKFTTYKRNQIAREISVVEKGIAALVDRLDALKKLLGEL